MNLIHKMNFSYHYLCSTSHSENRKEAPGSSDRNKTPCKKDDLIHGMKHYLCYPTLRMQNIFITQYKRQNKAGHLKKTIETGILP
ncbi:MAG: hypothetical protein B6245_23465 [Desulfobacteraceae bacterium 4572_88]|nr:MAG: hypothetical protein B6245_23465 [Desulfobacteraceae bacterium 4572_88]